METNKFKRAWISFWFHHTTRVWFVLIPGQFLIVVPLLFLFKVPTEYFRQILTACYVGLTFFAMVDSDFTKLHRIGLDASRKPLPPPTPKIKQKTSSVIEKGNEYEPSCN